MLPFYTFNCNFLAAFQWTLKASEQLRGYWEAFGSLGELRSRKVELFWGGMQSPLHAAAAFRRFLLLRHILASVMATFCALALRFTFGSTSQSCPHLLRWLEPSCPASGIISSSSAFSGHSTMNVRLYSSPSCISFSWKKPQVLPTVLLCLGL